MSTKSYREVYQNPAIKRYLEKDKSHKGGATAATISPGDLVEVSSGSLRKGTEQSTTIVGVTRDSVAASGQCQAEHGATIVKLASPVDKFDLLAARENGRAGKQMSSQVTLVDGESGGDFGNQPAGDGVTVVSSDAGDTTQTVTIYGTITGTTDEVTSETLTLNGTTDVDSTIDSWQNILAVKISAATDGNIEVSETSGGAEITTISAGTTSAGVVEPDSTNGYGLVLRHDADDATTAPIGIVGTGTDGSAISVVDALNGTTEEDHGTTAFATVSEVYVGALAAAVAVTILTNDSTDSINIGMAQESSSVAGVSIDAHIKPYYYA